MCDTLLRLAKDTDDVTILTLAIRAKAPLDIPSNHPVH